MYAYIHTIVIYIKSIKGVVIFSFENTSLRSKLLAEANASWGGIQLVAGGSPGKGVDNGNGHRRI